jgi:restriction system protein
MPIPDFQSLFIPILRVLQDSQEHHLPEVRERLVHDLQLSPEDLAEKLKSGQGLFVNRVAWAFVHLKRVEAVSSASRGAATYAASAQAFNFNQSFNQISSTLQGLGSIFEAPSFNYFNGTIHSPVYPEWNLQIQRDLGGSYALILAYNGRLLGRVRPRRS